MAQAQIIAKVSSLSGEAFARDSAGNLRRLKAGDAIREGESVVAGDGAMVLLKLADGRDMTVQSGEVAKLDAEVAAPVKPDANDSAIVNDEKGFQKIAKALTAGGDLDELLEDPAAGLAGPGGNEGHTFIEFARIVETVDPLAFNFPSGSALRNVEVIDGALQASVTTTTTTTTGATTVEPPKAINDSNSVTEDGTLVATGNVLTNDTLGVANATPVTTANTALTYGTLVLNSDGSYTYTLDNANPAVNALKNNETLTDSYTYTLTDGDGTSTTATLTITINGHTDGTPSLNIPDNNLPGQGDGDKTVAETDGAIPGDFTISAPAGLASLTVGGTTVTATQLSNLGTTPISINTGEGTLTLTGYDAATGQVSYTYDPEVQNHNGTVTDAIALVVTDTLGQHSNDSLDIQITDSVPVAVNDSNNITEDGTASITGSVLTNDTVGADANATPVTTANTALTYGTLVLNSDGSYTYTLDNANPAVNALKNNETLTDSYTYTLTDGDGTSTTATLTITINGHTDGTPSLNIPDNNLPGQGDGDKTVAETDGAIPGDFTISAPAGLASLTVGTTVITASQLGNLGTTPISINTGEGTLTLTGYDTATGQVSYTYDPEVQNHNGTVTDAIALVVTDTLGQHSNDSLDIQITDSVPVAVNDNANITEDASPNRVSGNVLNNDTVGADANATPVTTANTALTYGTLVLNSDGSYTYTLDNANPAVNGLKNNETLTDSYTYTLTDGDGTSTTATLTITINGHTDGTPSLNIPDNNLPGQGDGDKTVAETDGAIPGDFTISAPAGLASLTVGTTVITASQLGNLGTTPISINTGEGTLTLTGYDTATGQVSYTYDPEVQNHNGTVTDAIALVVTDTLGQHSNDSLDIQITDSVPVAVNDNANITEDASPNRVSGNVLNNDTVGADANATPVTTANTALTYGTLVLNSDGSYTYTLDNANPAVNGLKNNETLTDSYTYTLTDGDGTSTTATLTITINGHTDGTPSLNIPDNNLPGQGDGDKTVAETDGAIPGDFTISAPAGLASLTVGGTTVTATQLSNLGTTPISINTGEGTLTLTGYDAATGQVSYTYDPEVQNHNGTVTDAIALVVTDTLGQHSNDSLDIQITDSVPVAVNDSNNITEDGTASITGSVLTNDTVGADANATPVTTANTALTYGTLVLNSDGSYTYTLDNANPAVNALKNNETLTDSYTYTLTDGDGTSTTATLTITINGHTDGTPSLNIPDNNLPGQGDGDKTVAETDGAIPGDFTISAPAGLASLTVGTTVITASQLGNLGTTPISINTGEGTLTLTGYDTATGQVSYTYDPEVQNHNGTVTDAIALVVTDTLGQHSNDSLDIQITDSVPVAVNDNANITEDASPNRVSGNVLNNDTVGADANATPVTTANTALTYGTLVLNSDGSYTYTLDNANPAVNGLKNNETLTDSYTYTLTDGDGTSTTATLTITINGHTDGTPSLNIPDNNLPGQGDGDKTVAETDGAIPGDFTISAPAGLASLTVGTTVITASQLGNLGTTPISINTGEGTLTLTGYDTATGQVSYTYDPEVQNHNGTVTDAIALVVTDTLGQHSNDSLDIQITDSVPVAVNDNANITEDASPNRVSGNVLNNDTVGADANATPVTTANTALTYGTLVLNSDGSYTYTLDNANPAVNGLKNNETLTDSYTYTLTDGDGTSTTATLTITINGHTDGTPSLNIPDNNLPGQGDGDKTVAETDGAIPGDFTISAPAGLASLTVGTTVITASQLGNLGTTPISINTGEGTLTLTGYDTATGQVSYTYDPEVQNHNGTVTDAIALVVTDTLGQHSNDSLDIQITDSVPVAVNDNANITEDASPNRVSGNVLNNDTVGADANATPVTTANTALTYGTLVLNSDGSYTYTLDNANPAVNGLKNNETLTDSYTYTLTDGDGTSTTATLTITINGHTDGTPSLNIPDNNLPGQGDGDKTVAETDGAIPGDFTISAPAGLASLTVGTTVITASQLGNLGTTPISINTGEGTLKLTGYDATTGQVSYTYDPEVQNHNGTVTDAIALVVTDTLGQHSNDSLDIQITDSVPVAVNDNANITEDASPNRVSGNVLNNDTVGADANATPVTTANTALTYGTLVLNSDGSYTYTLDNANPAVNGLKNNETLTDSYTYTLTDGDGTSTTATLTITINGHTDGTPSLNIPDNNLPGQGDGDKTVAETDGAIPGDFTISAPAGLASLTVGGTTVTATQLSNLGTTPISINTGEGTLTLTGYDAATGQVSYTYDPEVQNHNGTVTDAIALVVTDTLGQHSNDSLDIQITDSVPVAVNDSNNITEDGTASITGSVLTNDTVGADANATPVTTANTALTYGTLVLNSDGSYTYTLDNANPAVNALKNNETLTDSYTYTLTDGDGTSTTATLTITINGHTDGTPSLNIPDNNLPGQGDGDKTVAETDGAIPGDFTISAPAGLASLTVGTTVITASQLGNLGTTPISINTGEGTLTLTGYDTATGQVSYTYDPEVQNHNGTVTDAIALVVTDTLGQHSNDSLDIQITDSVPVAVNDSNNITEDGTASITGSVLTNDTVGADANATPVTTANTALTYGTLVLNSDGSYTYTLDNANPAVNALKNNETLTDSYTYTLTDGDGTSTTATLTITINGHTDGTPSLNIPDNNLPGQGDGDKTVAETDGAIPGDFTISAPAGLASLTVGGTTVTATQLSNLGTTPISINTGEGTLTLTGYDAATGKVSYTYDPEVQNHNGTVTDAIALVVTDTLGQHSNDSLDIQITDSVPVAVNDSNNITEDASPNRVSGNVLNNDTVGADANATPVTTANTALTYGTLVLNSDGSYTYTLDNANPAVNGLKNNETLTDSYTYTLTDGDGTSTTATLTITINGHTDGTPSLNIPDNNLPGQGDGDKTVAETDGAIPGDFTISAPAGLASLTVGGTTVTATQLSNLGTTPISINTGEGTLTLTGYDAATGKVSYTYDPEVQNHNGTVTDAIALVVTDTLGQHSNDSLDIQITDSVPVAVNDNANITEDASPNRVSGNVLNNDTVGADANATPVTTANTALTYGTLVLNSDGSYTYTLDNANPAVNGLKNNETLTDSYTYTLTDGDGTSTTATLTITINGHTDGTPSLNIPDNNLPGQGDGDKTVAETDGAIPGDFTISAPAGLASLTVGGTTVTATQLSNLGTTPISINTGEGTLTLTGYDAATGKVSYTYDPEVQNHNGTVTDAIALVVTDTLGQHSNDSLDIQITDSVPVAVNDSNNITEDGTASITGSVLTNDTVGADANATPVTTANTALTYGTLVLNSDGSYTYTLDNANPAVNALKNNETLTDSYTYTLTDGDGTSTTATLTITINGHTDGTPSITPVDGNGAAAGQATVNEIGLISNSDNSESTTGTITVSAPDGLASITVDGTTVTAAQLANLGTTPISINTGEGQLTLTGYNAGTGALSYSYTLSAAQNQTGATESLDNISLVVTDQGGGSNTGTLGIRIVDSTPSASNDNANITEDASPNRVSGNVLSNDTVGADANATPVTAANTALTYGTLVLNSDGSYTYTLDNANPAVNALKNNETLTDSYTYTITDGDGDTKTATLTITINGSNDAPVVVGSTVSGTEDTALVLSWSNFGISDVDSPTITAVTISTLPADGTLQFFNGTAWVSVTAEQVVSKASVDAGYLRFVPDANESGSSVYSTSGQGDQHVDYATFKVSVTDSSGATASGNVIVDIAPIVDAVSLARDTSSTGSVSGGNSITPPTSVGLTREYFQALAGIGSSAQSSAPDSAETAIEAATPTTTTVITNVGPATGAVSAGSSGVAIAVDDAYEVSGLIYLEAGKSYVFSGYIDDTFRLEIGGTTVVSGQWGGSGQGSSGTFTSITYTPTVSGYYTVDLFVYNTSGPGSYDLNVSVNSGADQDLSTANFFLYPTISTLDATGAQHGAFVANTTTGEGGYYPASLNVGQEDTTIKLSALTTSFGDSADNSESHVVTLAGIPVGAVISDGTHTFTATAGNTSFVLWNEDVPTAAAGGSNWNLATLTITPPTDYNGTLTLTATATATEIATGQSTSASTTIDVTVVAVNDAPVIGTVQGLSVSEEGLSGGFADTTGSPDTTNSATASGSVSISDVDSSVSVTLTAPTATLTSGGTTIVWSGSGTQTLIGTAGGVEVIRATIDNNGNYTVTLSKGIDQSSTSSEDSSTINFGISASDGAATTTATLSVTVEDDSPVATTTSADIGATAASTNLAIVLDLSGSMAGSSGLTGLTRLQATIAAIKELIDGYDSLGDVMVNVTVFGSTATAGTWMTAANAVAYLNTLSASLGNTNYDAALAAAMSAFASSGKLTASNTQNVLYFLSDGEPNRGDNNASSLLNVDSSSDSGINTTEEGLWTSFLTTNDINSIAIGIGSGVTTSTMDPVAYNGATGANSSSLVVTDLSTLSSTLAATVTNSVSGSITSGAGSTGGFGGDGGHLAAIVYGNNTFSFDGSTLTVSGSGTTSYTFNATTHELTLVTAGGSFLVDMDTGAYTYSTSANASVSQEVFNYTLTDSDGDSASGALTLNLNGYDAAPVVRDDSVIVQSSAVSSGSVTIKDLWLTWNDSDAEGSSISVASVANATSHVSSQVVDSVTASSGGTGAFTYVATDGHQTNDAAVSITTQSSTTLTGSGLDNILIGGSSADTINGNEGNDVLVGNAGNDTLNGGAGIDLLIGGFGNDTLTGGAGADVFRFELADKAVTAGVNVSSTASDTITDFSTSTTGESLDLRDLLQNFDSATESLSSFIDITTSGSNTVIRVSSGGGFSGGTYASGAEDQRITLSGVNLYTAYGVTAGDDATLLQKLISNGKLIVD